MTTTEIIADTSNAVVGERTAFSLSTAPVQGADAVPSGTVQLFTAYGALSPVLPLLGGHVTTFVEWDYAVRGERLRESTRAIPHLPAAAASSCR